MQGGKLPLTTSSSARRLMPESTRETRRLAASASEGRGCCSAHQRSTSRGGAELHRDGRSRDARPLPAHGLSGGSCTDGSCFGTSCPEGSWSRAEGSCLDSCLGSCFGSSLDACCLAASC